MMPVKLNDVDGDYAEQKQYLLLLERFTFMNTYTKPHLNTPLANFIPVSESQCLYLTRKLPYKWPLFS